MKMIYLMSLIFILTSHPIMMIMILIMITLIMSLCLMLMLKTTWFSMILILIMLGGMLIMFIYMASLTSNEPFKKFNFMYLIILMMIPIIKYNLHLKTFNNFNMQYLYSTISSYNNQFIIIYLLMSLLVVIYIIKNFKSSLQSM